MKRSSLYALLLCYACMFYAGMIYYPKWRMPSTEATIGWDVAGYYSYLPAIFIYKDLKQLSFYSKIAEKYSPNSAGIQAFKHEQSGNMIIKYSAGMSLMYSPFFFIAHSWANMSGGRYPADGFSFPYQFMISFGSLLIAFLGLFVLRKLLLQFFSEGATALCLLSIGLLSNYLEYAAISGAMTHNWQFSIFVSVIYLSVIFYKNPTYKIAAFIGLLCGLAALARPTDILIAGIPFVWGLDIFSRKAILERLQLYWTEKGKLLTAAFCTAAVGSIQAFYWKYVSGEWVVYSYKGEGFSWLSPHVTDAFFSYKTGWLLYSPVMYFALVGFIFLFIKDRKLWGATFGFFLLFSYVVTAWDNWWYGGGLGLRAMVQGYAILAFPMAAFWERMLKYRLAMIPLGLLSLLFLYYNIWLTHQAHRGGLLIPAEVTKAYFWRILGRYSIAEEDKKLLDTDKIFRGSIKNVKTLAAWDFESDTSHTNCDIAPIQGEHSLCMNASTEFSPNFDVPVPSKESTWLRISADYRCAAKEWETWKMCMVKVSFIKGEKTVKSNFLRIFRFLHDGQTRNIYLDARIPKKDFDKIIINYWNPGGQKSLSIDNLKVEAFNE